MRFCSLLRISARHCCNCRCIVFLLCLAGSLKLASSKFRPISLPTTKNLRNSFNEIFSVDHPSQCCFFFADGFRGNESCKSAEFAVTGCEKGAAMVQFFPQILSKVLVPSESASVFERSVLTAGILIGTPLLARLVSITGQYLSWILPKISRGTCLCIENLLHSLCELLLEDTSSFECSNVSNCDENREEKKLGFLRTKFQVITFTVVAWRAMCDTARDFEKQINPSQNQRGKSSPIMTSMFVIFNPREIFALGAFARALQICTPIQFIFDPSVGTAALIVYGALNIMRRGKWFAYFVIGWTSTPRLWKLFGASYKPREPQNNNLTTIMPSLSPSYPTFSRNLSHQGQSKEFDAKQNALKGIKVDADSGTL